MGVIQFPVWRVYCFLNARGDNVIKEWLKDEKVSVTQRAIFQQRIDLLESGGPDMLPGFIQGPVAKDIYKMKIKGNKGHVQLRPMVCRGPFGDSEYTMLLGAIEKDSVLHPKDCKQRAQENRKILLTDNTRRRREPIT